LSKNFLALTCNEDVIRVVERHGGEAWLADVAEWIWYTDSESARELRLAGMRFSMFRLRAKLKTHVQRADEHRLYEPFREDFLGYEEPESIDDMLKRTKECLPRWGALGEITLSAAKAVYLYSKGADGVIDISPFTCMNAITCEAIYPRISRDFDDIPIRNFYFDGTQTNLDRDVGIFMELARSYQKKKTRARGSASDNAWVVG
jgi:predicted nucleotide-binding protein (sugar kinase/HSP70/actin superfamily)